MKIRFGALTVEWDAEKYYRSHGQILPPTPTLSGAELRSMIPGYGPTNALEHNGRSVGDREAFALYDGILFDVVPYAHY